MICPRETRAAAATRYVDRCRAAGDLRETFTLLLELGLTGTYATTLLIEMVSAGPDVTENAA